MPWSIFRTHGCFLGREDYIESTRLLPGPELITWSLLLHIRYEFIYYVNIRGYNTWPLNLVDE